MRLERIELQDITRFSGPVSIDCASLGPGLIAFAGPNGEGKTTLLELFYAASYLEYPSYKGPLYGVAHGCEAKLETRFSNGLPYHTLVAIDAGKKKTEAYLFGAGEKPLTDGKVGEFKEQMSKILGSRELGLSSWLSSQKKLGNFLKVERAQKKDIFAEILDTEGVQALSKGASEQGKAAEKKLENLRGQIAAREAELQGLPVADLAELQKENLSLANRLASLNAELEAARGEYVVKSQKLTAAQEREKEREKKVLALADLQKAITETRAKKDALADELKRLQDRIAAAQEREKAEAARGNEYRAAEAKLKEVCEGRPAIEAALKEAEECLRTLLDRHVALRDTLHKADTLKADLQRAMTSSGLLQDVPCHGEGAFAGCGFLKQAQQAKSAIPTISVALQEAEHEAGALPSTEVLIREAKAVVETKQRELQAFTGEIGTLQAAAAKLQNAKAAERRVAELEQERMDGEGGIHKREGEYSASLAKLEEQSRQVGREIEASAAEGIEKLKADVSAVAEKGRGLKEQAAKTDNELKDLLVLITRAQVAEKRRNELTVLLGMDRQGEAELVKDVGEWKILELGLGRNGIQAFEIEAAGPEISSLCNQLLRCYGERFEISFVTQVPRADGDGMKDEFEVMVIDHERGRQDPADRFSGGEETILSEAVSLAISLYVTKHSGKKVETIFRDETAGQLDPDRASAYIRMLRKARELGGLHQVYFIAQQPDVYEAADVVLWVEGGRVERMEGGAA